MKKLWVLSVALFITVNSFALNQGILVVAHGSSCHFEHGVPPTPWEKAVLDTVALVAPKISHPIEVAFGMWSTESYNEAIQRLEKKFSASSPMEQLVVVPLFLSSFSIVIDMQKYIFRQTSEKPPIEAEQVAYSGKILYGKPMDYDTTISDILVTRAKTLAAASKETMVGKLELNLVMHGPNEEWENHMWLMNGHQYAADMARLGFAEIHVLTLRDDCDKSVKERAAEMLRDAVSGAAKRGHKALVLPFTVSSKGIEHHITDILGTIEFVWTGETLLPDARISDYILRKITEAARP
ncbi:MAG: hypothetical protein HY537_02730 [Deltaproteobacteria bacterium]|nr:hypothetical protein [Deltaproteobacteria bacterium]